MAEIPRLSYDLIDLLDRSVDKPGLPDSGRGFGNLSESVVRAIAFDAGFRACVDMLLDMRASDEEEADAALSPPEPDERDPFLAVYGPDGQPHTGVASTHMAGRLAPEDDDDGGES